MCNFCNNNGIDRRDFLKISGTTVALGGLWATNALAHITDGNNDMPVIEKNKTKMAVLFLYPSDDIIREGRTGDNFSRPGWYTWPGNQFNPELNREKYTKKIVEFAKNNNIDLSFQGVIGTKTEVNEYITKTKASPPDALLIFNFWNSFSSWVLEMSQQLAPLPMIVYHPVGGSHQHPPKGLMNAPGMMYIHSRENWEILENAMIAANAKKMMSQSRLLRIGNYKEVTKGIDEQLGVEIIAIPAVEYNNLFDSIKAGDALVREAMAFKRKATAVNDVEDKYLVDGFRSREAVLEIMKRYNADGITIRCLELKERKPCIAFSLCNSALIPCACEDQQESAISLMIGAHLFKKGGFMHNPDFDIERNQYFASHCTCPLELYGPGKGFMPFHLRPFMHELPKTGAVDVHIPPGERVFLTRYIPQNKEIFVYTGTLIESPDSTVSGGCTTRFVLEFDKIDDVCSIYHGPHPIMYCGDATEAKRIKAFANLTQLKFTGNV